MLIENIYKKGAPQKMKLGRVSPWNKLGKMKISRKSSRHPQILDLSYNQGRTAQGEAGESPFPLVLTTQRTEQEQDSNSQEFLLWPQLHNQRP